MNRKLLGGLAAAALAAVAIWLLFLRGGEDGAKAATKETKRSGKLAQTAPPAPVSQGAAERGLAPKWSLDLDPEGPLRLEGQVQGPNGEPMAGVEVTLSSSPARTVKSEDDGSFAFDKLVGRTYSLTASTADLVGGPVTYKLIAGADPVVIRLAEGARLAVSVIGEDKAPIADAEVKSEQDRTTKTDKDGKAIIKPVRTGWAGVEVTAKGYAPATGFTTIGSAGSTGTLTVTLHKGLAVSGRVVDETGKPVAKAHVVANRDGAMWGLGGGGEPAETNDKGEFAFAALAAGTVRLHVVDGEHAPATSAPVTIRETAVTGVEITMKAGGSVAGIVVDRDAKPVAYATVHTAATNQSMWQVATRQATTDKEGKFELRGLARTKVQLRAESDTAASKITDVDLEAELKKQDIKLVLDVSGTITGTVVDETGQPVAEVQVHAFPDLLGGANADGIALAGMSTATTDGNGAFAVHGLPDGVYRVWAARSGGGFRGDMGEHGVSAKPGDKGVKLVLGAPGTVIGKIALDGAAPKLATISLGPEQMPTPVENGLFAVKDLPPGTYDAVLHGPEFAEYIKHDVKVEPGKTTDLGTLDVSRGRRVTGKVIDGAGAPVANVKVRLGQMLFSLSGAEDLGENFDNMQGMRAVATDQDGAFVISGVSKKATNVAAADADHGQSTATAIPAGTDDPPPITLVLHGWGSITGKVTLKGAPQGGVQVTETTKNGGAQMAMTQTDADGNFTMAKVAEGTHVLSAMQQKGMGMSMKSTSATVTVTAGKESHVVIDIPVGQIALTVQIKPLSNQQVDAAQIFLFNGVVAATNAKQLTDGFLGGGVLGMKFWFGAAAPPPVFDELMPGDFTVCSVPITGSLQDTQFQQRLQEHMDVLKVYCKTVKVPASPTAQTITQDLPAMSPLPT